MKSRIGFLLLVGLLVLVLAAACGDDDDDNDAAGDDDTAADDDDTTDDDDNNDATPPDDDDDDDTAPWEPIEPHRETYEGWTIVWLAGTAHEMGVQQGTLLHEELAAGVDWLNEYHLIDLLLPVARWLGLTDIARENSYPDVLQECQGLVETAGDVGWTMDLCLLLNFGDMLVEFLADGFPPAQALAPGCSQIVASGEATVDGRLYHGRGLDWSEIDYLLDYPVIFVRQPVDGIPHAFIGFPGNLSPYSGINAAGISVASNENDPIDNSVHDRVGRSHVQMQAQLLKYADSLEAAEDFILAQDHMTVEIITVADGNTGEAAVFEMTAVTTAVRRMVDGVVIATNHFLAPETDPLDEETGDSSRRRLERAQELVEKDGAETGWGSIDAEYLVSVLRDRTNPDTGEVSPPGTFDDNNSIATNGAIYQMVFAPGDLCFWVAAGEIPVPEQPFVGFSLGELLQLPDAVVVTPLVYE
jgi:Acyl-coenzyme A:6-aminopenicillanic acid acyl-transferase